MYLILLAAFLAYQSWRLYPEDKIFSFFFAALVPLLLFRLAWSMRYPAVNIIPRESIRAVRFIRAIPYLTRSRLIVTFEDENGKLQKCLIPLPGWLNEGDRHTEEAIALLKNEKLFPFPSVVPH
jgi:hypothetical protein